MTISIFYKRLYKEQVGFHASTDVIYYYRRNNAAFKKTNVPPFFTINSPLLVSTRAFLSTPAPSDVPRNANESFDVPSTLIFQARLPFSESVKRSNLLISRRMHAAFMDAGCWRGGVFVRCKTGRYRRRIRRRTRTNARARPAINKKEATERKEMNGGSWQKWKFTVVSRSSFSRIFSAFRCSVVSSVLHSRFLL